MLQTQFALGLRLWNNCVQLGWLLAPKQLKQFLETMRYSLLQCLKFMILSRDLARTLIFLCNRTKFNVHEKNGLILLYGSLNVSEMMTQELLRNQTTSLQNLITETSLHFLMPSCTPDYKTMRPWRQQVVNKEANMRNACCSSFLENILLSYANNGNGHSTDEVKLFPTSSY